MQKLSKKTKGIVLIILGISVALLGMFLLNSKENKKQQPTPSNIILSENNTKTDKIILEVNDKKYESETKGQISVYDFMSQLQKERKITFKEKYYTGMGEFIEEINGIKNGDKNWIYYVNGKKAEIGISNYQIKTGDVVSWKYEKTS